MSSSSRSTILSRVNQALAPLSVRAALPQWDEKLPTLSAVREAPDLWQFFSDRLRLVNGVPLSLPQELVAWLRDRKHLRGYCDAALWPQLQPHFGNDFAVETTFDRTRVDDYAFGITRAAGGIAETGSVILNDRLTSTRLGALAPWVHVAVFNRENLYGTVGDAIRALGDDPNIVWATGPSKTADVEGILIEGVHGPGAQLALMLG